MFVGARETKFIFCGFAFPKWRIFELLPLRNPIAPKNNFLPNINKRRQLGNDGIAEFRNLLLYYLLFCFSLREVFDDFGGVVFEKRKVVFR